MSKVLNRHVYDLLSTDTKESGVKILLELWDQITSPTLWWPLIPSTLSSSFSGIHPRRQSQQTQPGTTLTLIISLALGMLCPVNSLLTVGTLASGKALNCSTVESDEEKMKNM
eukprot:754743-Ditylum_brightwellii.AAC.1